MDKNKEVEMMKKTIVLLVALLSLTACAQSRHESKDSSPSKTDQTSKESSSVKNETGLQFVLPPQYEGKETNVIELGKKLTKEHPELGNQGSLSINYTGATFSSNQQEYAVFLLINKAGFQIDKDFDFSLNWKYDGQFIYQNQRIGYKISDSGALPDQSATILTLPISSEQKQIVETMTQEEKMSLEISDLKVNK
jgi:probable lipoprotein